MKKWCLALALLTLLFLFGTAIADAGNTLDIIMILDYSGSMSDNDSQRLMVMSVMNFIDMCDTNGSRVALLPFNSRNFLGNENWTRDFGYFRNIDSIAEREEIRQKLLGIDYHYGGDADGGPAFQKAWELYSARNEDPSANEKTIVIFFSDGKISVKNDPAYSEVSLDQANEYIDLFVEAGVPIYCIGLSSAGDFDKDWLDQIAQKTGTGSARVIVDGNNCELHEKFSEVFAEWWRTTPLAIEQQDIAVEENQAVVSFTIPNNSVSEANIRLSIPEPNRSEFGDLISLIGPNGRVIDPKTSGTLRAGDVVAGNSITYFNVKILQPEQGEWKLALNIKNTQQVNAEMILDYDLAVRFRDTASSVFVKGYPLKLEAELYSTRTGEICTDEYLYRPEMLVQSIARHDGEPLDGFYQPDDINHLFTGNISRLDHGSYEFQIKLEGDGLQIETDRFGIDVTNIAPIRIGTNPNPIELSADSLLWRKANDRYNINLHEYFRDPDDDELHFAVLNSEGTLPADLRITPSGMLEIICYDPGEAKLEIQAIDDSLMAESTLPLTITITSCADQALRELLLITGCVLLMLLIVLVLVARSHKPRFRRNEQIRIEINDVSELILPLKSYRSAGVSLWRLLVIGGYAKNHKSDRSMLKRITFVPKRDQVIVRENKSNRSMATGYTQEFQVGNSTFAVTLEAAEPNA